ncbi:MAG: hypothetical protein CMH57_02485 [Myxococcales bacterium]|nr:hypothetical protein [Myxococcales bacterium]
MGRFTKQGSRMCPWCGKGVAVVQGPYGTEVWLDGTRTDLEPAADIPRSGGAPIHGVIRGPQGGLMEVALRPYHECEATGRVLSRRHVIGRWRQVTARLSEPQKVALWRRVVRLEEVPPPHTWTDVPIQRFAFRARELEGLGEEGVRELARTTMEETTRRSGRGGAP